MINKMEKLPLSIVNKLPIKIKDISDNYKYYLIEDLNNTYFHLYSLTKKEYLTYYELIKSKKIQKSIYELNYNDRYYLLFDVPYNKSEDKVISSKMLDLICDIYKEFSFSISLKKEHFRNLQNTYKVLDNKFTYLEMRIREVETSPIKNDISWIILSKYNIILDAKIYLYDLQQDLFKFIDNNESVEYGLIFNAISKDAYKNGLIEPQFKEYYGPISSLLVRYFLLNENKEIEEKILSKISKLDKFNQKFFCFLTLYIYVINIMLDITLNEYNINSYLQITRRIRSFIKIYGGYMK